MMNYSISPAIFVVIFVMFQSADSASHANSKAEEYSVPELFLVTGGAGFIGSALVDALLEMNKRVRVIDNLETGFLHNLDLLNPNLEFVQGNILDKDTVFECMKDVTGIFHLAAASELAVSPPKASIDFAVNTLGTANVLEAAALSSTVKRFIYVGSAVNTNKSDSFQDPFFRSSPQASSKCMGELMTESYDKTFNLSTVSVRFFAVFGPRQPMTGSYAPKQIIQNLSPLPYFMHVGEVVKGLLKAYDATDVRRTSILLASRAGRTNADIIRLIDFYDSEQSRHSSNSNSLRRSFSEGDDPDHDMDITESVNVNLENIIAGWMTLSSEDQSDLLGRVLSEGYPLSEIL